MPSDESQAGHRKRLREKFLKSGLSGFHDYEIVEMLLMLGTPRRDCKPQAKEAVRRFKSLRGVLEASPEALQEIDGIGQHSVFGIKLVQEISRQFLKEKVMEKPVMQSSREVFEYLSHSMRDLRKEVFKVLYLDSQNQVLEVADLSQGTVDSTVVYAREVMELALRYSAVSMIVAHNHPSGNPTPSSNDCEITRQLVYAGNALDVRLLDHIIIGDNTFYSFAVEGLLEQYQTDYLSLKLKSASPKQYDG